MPSRLRRGIAALAGVAGLVASGLAAGAPTVAAAAGPDVVPLVTGHYNYYLRNQAGPPTTADCQAEFGINCYSPNQIETAYDTPALYNQGITGRGETIAVVDSFGSPTIKSDLQTFDETFGLPDPPSLRVIHPAGPVPTFDPNDPTMDNWAFETSLDVEYAHAMAPEANILLVETPVAETEGTVGLPKMMRAENSVIDRGMADVISQSFGATENTFPSEESLRDLRGAFKNARQHHVTMLASSGDDGATDAENDGSTLYPYRVNSWPSSDPLVTSIGGTMLSLDANGNRTSPDVVWNDGYGAGGGGKSEYFSRPKFQDDVRSVVGNSRGTPDISMSAAVNGGVIVYESFDSRVGFHIVGGTSEASPLFAGIVALADQVAGKKLGDLNKSLYALDGQRRSGIVDVTSGDNSFGGVTGYPAKKRYDLVSGLGTVDAAQFVPALAGQAG